MKKSTEKTKKSFKPSKKAIIATALCATAVLLVVSFFAYAATYTKILPNVIVQDVNIGGMTMEDAEKEIQNSFGDIASGRSVKLNCCGNERSVAFDEFNFETNVEKTVTAAYKMGCEMGSFKRGLKMLALAFNPEHIGLEFDFDKAELYNVINELSEGKEVAPAETDYILEGNKLTIIKGHGGKVIDRDKAAEKIIGAIIDPTKKEITLELETVAAKPTDLEEFYQKVTAPEKNAEYILENGEIRIEPEKPGIKVEKSKIKEALAANRERYELTVETVAPEITAEELKKLLFRDTLGSFSSSFATSSNARASNVILTANRINGKILMPGDVFSYDTAIGRRTVANGYKEAGVYIGNKVESGIGGGICQTSSTLYSAVLYSNLEIVTRTSHSLPVSYVPMGQDATIAEGYIDFKFKNNTEYPIKIVANVNGRRLTCSLLGVKHPNISVEVVNTVVSTAEPKTERTENAEIPKGYKRILNKGAKGYTVASQRIVKEGGKVIKTEKLTRSVYRAAPIEEEVNPADKDTPTEKLKIYTPGMEVSEETPDAEKPETVKPEEPKPELKPEEAPPSEEVEEIVNV